MSSLPVVHEPTCTFWGGPWDGRVFCYPHLFTHFYVPECVDLVSVVLPNFALADPRGYRDIPVHVYERGPYVAHGQKTIAKYYYRGTR